MDDEDFDDLFAEAEVLEDSSQESLTSAAANLGVHDLSNDESHSIQVPDKAKLDHEILYNQAIQCAAGSMKVSILVSNDSGNSDTKMEEPLMSGGTR